MIQDYINTFEDRQTVKIKPLSFKGSRLLRKNVGVLLTGAMVVGLSVCLVFGFLIRSGLNDLARIQVSKIELIKAQQSLYEKRQVLLDRDRIESSVKDFGLLNPIKGQIRHL